MKVGSTFTGAGGLDMAVTVLWPDAELAWFSENDNHAAAVFAHHHPDVPNLGDMTAVDWSDVEPVDVIVGGFPCQDISHAGRQAGIKEGTRSGLWFELLHAAVQLRPRLLLLENVAAVTSAGGGLDVVLGSLAEVGWDAEWTCLRASDVGAPHRRDRWFAVAWPADTASVGRFSRSGLRTADEGGVGGRRPDHHREQDDVDLLPTPNAGGFNDGESVESWLARRDRMKERHDNGNGMGTPLNMAVKMLPTPRAGADRASRGALTKDGHWSAPSLAQAVELAQGRLPREYESWDEVQGWHGKVFPTPRSSDGPHGGPNQTGDGLQPAVRELLPTPVVTDARGARNATSGRSDPDSNHHGGTTLGDVAYADRWGEHAPAVARWERILGRPAPSPTDGEGRLSPEFVEWMMAFPAGWTDVADTSRTQRLKMLGNGVVPHQAAHAYRHLLERVSLEAA